MSLNIRVRGLASAQKALDDAMRDVHVESEEMLAVMLQAISANTMPYVPVDSSTLINSERRRTWMTGEGPAGSIDYGSDGSVNPSGTPVQEYAAYVHEGPQKNWQKGTASNLFLARGTRDFVRDDLSQIIARYQP